MTHFYGRKTGFADAGKNQCGGMCVFGRWRAAFVPSNSTLAFAFTIENLGYKHIIAVHVWRVSGQSPAYGLWSLNKIYDFVCLGRCGSEMNCAVVWEDVDIRVMHSSGKHSPVFLHCVSEKNNLRKMLHWCYIKPYQNNELPALLETMWGKACNSRENK